MPKETRKILYISSVWAGIKPLLFEGKQVPEGMPAFFNVLKRLAERGYHVDFVFIGGAPRPLNITADWLKNSRIEQVTRPRGVYMPGTFAKQLGNVVNKMIKEQQPDFIYLHGFSASQAAAICRRSKIPFGQRVYGIRNLDQKVQQYSKLRLKIKYAWELEAFQGEKSFVIVTRDGSRGDKVYQALAQESRVPMYFSLNGVNKTHLGEPQINPLKEDKPFIFYPSRFAKRKCNDAAVDFLRGLHQKGQTKFHLVFAGQESDPEMLAKTKEKVNAYGLSEFVHFAGVLNAEQMRDYYSRCAAVASFYSVANLGNVTLEALSHGCVLISLQDESLDGIVIEGETGLLSRDVKTAANNFAELLQNEKAFNQLRLAAKEHAEKILPSWEQRADWEISLIDSAINQEELPPSPAYAQCFRPGA